MARGIQGTDIFVQADIEHIFRGLALTAALHHQHAGATTDTAQAFFDGYCAGLLAAATALDISPRALEPPIQPQPEPRLFARPQGWRRE